MALNSSFQNLTHSDSLEVNELVSRAFGYIAPHTFFDDFPIWDLRLQSLAEKNIHSLGIRDQNRLVSHVGARIAEVKLPNLSAKKRIGIIGAVATSMSHRGQGLSTKLLNEAIALLEASNCEWIILWGSEHDFYKKIGFELSGLQCRTLLKFSRLISKQSTTKPKINTGFHEKIFQHLVQSPCGIVIREEDRTWVTQHKTIEWYWIEEPFAFIGYQRGMDLTHLIHEFGGDKTLLASLFDFILRKEPGAQILGQKKDLLALGFSDDEFIEEHLCLARPTKPHTSLPEGFWISGLGAS